MDNGHTGGIWTTNVYVYVYSMPFCIIIGNIVSDDSDGKYYSVRQEPWPYTSNKGYPDSMKPA